MTHRHLDAMYKAGLDFIDREKFLDLCEKLYEAGYEDGSGKVFENNSHNKTHVKEYSKRLNRKYKSIAEVLRRKQP